MALQILTGWGEGQSCRGAREREMINRRLQKGNACWDIPPGGSAPIANVGQASAYWNYLNPTAILGQNHTTAQPNSAITTMSVTIAIANATSGRFVVLLVPK